MASLRQAIATHLAASLALAFAAATAASSHAGQTELAIADGKWRLNGKVTAEGSAAEGLLMNVRMVNATFEDAARDDFDPDANTERFLEQIPSYAAHGVQAFTLCLQGGHCGYEGAVNSAFRSDGSLRAEYLARVRRVIEACDRQGLAVILGCYYQRQDQLLADEAAVRRGVEEAARWIAMEGFSNVALEIANEYPHRGFDHAILRSPQGQASLVRLAKQANPKLLVSTSGIGNGRLDDEVARECDFLLIHFNGTPVEQIPARIAALKKHGKPIVCNEDDKSGAEAARAAEASVRSGASWGLMLNRLNQYAPFEFHGADDDPIVYRKLKELTMPRGEVKLMQTDQGWQFSEGGEPVAFYQQKEKSLNGRWPRANYLHPVHDLSGRVVTEDFPSDHGHHRGVFWAWHQVWAGDTRLGDAWECKRFEWVVADAQAKSRKDGAAELSLRVLWQSPDWTDEAGRPKPAVEERTILRVHPRSAEARRIDFEIALTALAEGVRIGGSEDEKGYGGFSPRIKLPPDVRFQSAGRQVAPQVTAVEAGPWMDVRGAYAEGAAPSGVAILCHPSLPEHPPRWILRDRRSMQNAAWPGREAAPLSTSEPLVLRYALLLHNALDDAALEAHYKAYAQGDAGGEGE